MGLFDFFTREGKMKRHVRRMSNRDTPPEDREVSAHWLSEEGSPQALYGLLTRFDLQISQGLKDKSEKELVFQLLLQHGGAVSEPLEQWFAKCKQYAWPLKLLERIEGEQAAVDKVLQLLEGEVGKASFDPSKKIDLLKWLIEHDDARITPLATRFLTDFDEGVRYVAVEAVLSQDGEDRDLLWGVLTRPEEDSGRLMHRVCEVFAAKGWSVEADALQGRLPEAFAVQQGRLVRA